MSAKTEAWARLGGSLGAFAAVVFHGGDVQFAQDAVLEDAEAYAAACVAEALEIERNTRIVQEANHDEDQYAEALADSLELLERLVGPLMWDGVMQRFHDKSGKERSIEISRRTLDANRSELRYFIDDVKGTREEAAELL